MVKVFRCSGCSSNDSDNEHAQLFPQEQSMGVEEIFTP